MKKEIEQINKYKILSFSLVQNLSLINDSSSKLAYSYSAIERNLQCPMCLKRFYRPRVLPCQHIFCSLCLKMMSSIDQFYSTIICSICCQTFPYNNIDQFPQSYIHNQLLTLVPINYDIEGKCFRCKNHRSLIYCLCCDYYLCSQCFQNDRENIFINLKNIVLQLHCYFQYMKIRPSLEIDNLLYQAHMLLNNTQTIEFHDILSVYYSIRQQYCKLPMTITEQIHENLLNKKQIDDDNDIIYIGTVESRN